MTDQEKLEIVVKRLQELAQEIGYDRVELSSDREEEGTLEFYKEGGLPYQPDFSVKQYQDQPKSL